MLIVTNKMLDIIQSVLSDKTYIFACEGSIRSIKTTTMVQAFHFAVQQSDKTFHLLAGQNNDAIRDVLLYSEMGLLNLYPEFYEIKKDKIGGFYLSVKAVEPGEPQKRILLCGFADKSRWKVVVGKELGVVLIDECNLANRQFVNEIMARQTNVDYPKLLLTLNGDSPTHPIYTDLINFCKILGNAPNSIVNDMIKCENKEGWKYCHFTMEDNPMMTPEKIDRAKKIYPKDSYYYKIKILGERGTSGSLIFNDYMVEEKHLKSLDLKAYSHYVVGLDIGATKAQTSLTLVGFCWDYRKVGVIDNFSINQVGYDVKKRLILNKVLEWAQNKNIVCVSVDSAEQNFIIDLKSAFLNYGIEIVPSYKATIKQRIDLLTIMLSLGIIEFEERTGAKSVFQAYQMAKWVEGKEGQEREDNNDPINDKMDSLEYALTVYMKTILALVKEATR